MAIETALVVDDSRSARYILQRQLERQHIHVDGVDSAEEALAYLREVRPDVVFMDDMMPGMNGREAVERLAANPVTARIPIVMYTGRDDMPITPSQQRGVIGVLGKPFAPQDVDALLAKLGGTVAPPVTARLIRQPVNMHLVPTPVPVEEAAASPLSDELARRVTVAVAMEMNALRADLIGQVKTESRLAVEQVIGELLEDQVRTQIEHREDGWRHALVGVRKEQNIFQEHLLERRVPRLLEIMEQRMRRRMDVLQNTLNERIVNSNLGPQQRTEVIQLARTIAVEAAQRPAREAARRVAAELMRTDINATNVRLERLRRRFSVLITSAAIAVLAAAVLGYILGMMR